MDFNDDRSIFSNSQLALDNMQNINQNDFLQSNYDAHVMQFFVNDSPMLNVPNQYEHQPPPPNVLCSPNQPSSNTNPLKAQTTHHQSQPNLNSNQNRSRGLSQPPPQHHPYQQQQQQPPPQQIHNQFHNQAQPTSKPQFISNVPLNQQPLNYVNIPKDNKPMAYSEVVNHSNVLNNPNCNVYNNGIHNNNGLNHPMHRQRPLQQPPQHQPPSHQPPHQQMNMMQQQQPNNSMPPIKNGNNSLLIEQQQKSAAAAAYYSSPPNYYNNLSPQANNLQQQQSPPINNSMNANSINNSINSSINNSCFVDKKSPPISMNGNGLNNFFSGGDLANRNNLIKPPIVEKVPPDQAIAINIAGNSSLNSFNSISSPSPSSNLTPSHHHSIITPKKSQTSELNSSSTVHQLESKTTKQKAETKTVIIFKIIDQVVFNGQVVRETVVSNEEIVRQTGCIDWPADGGGGGKDSVKDSVKEGGTFSEVKSDAKTEAIKQTTTTDKSSGSASKKSITPKASKNLKRSSVGQQAKEKKIKTETRIDSPSKYKAEQPKKSPSGTRKEAAITIPSVEAAVEEKKPVEEKKVAEDKKPVEDKKVVEEKKEVEAKKEDEARKEVDVKEAVSLAESGNNSVGKSIPEINITPETIASSSSTTKQQPVSSPHPPNAAFPYEMEDPVFKPIDLDQRVLAKWTDRNWYPGKVLAKENDSKWKIGFDDGGRRLIRENEIMCIEFIPNGQKVMTMVNYHSHYCLKGTVKSRRINELDECYYTIEHYSNQQCYETEYISKDVFLNGEHAVSLLSRRKQNANDSKFADVDLNNIIPKRSRASIKSILNESSNGPNDRNSLTAEIEMIDNDSNSNLSCSTNNSSATTSSASKKTTIKKGKSAGKQVNASSNEETPPVGGVPKSAGCEAKIGDGLAKSETQTNNVESKPDRQEELRLNDSFEDNLIGPIPNATSELFKSFAFLLSFEDSKQSNDEVAGYSIPFDIGHLTKQITNGSGLILEKYEDVKQDNYQVVLVSHSYLKTVKYLQCLSSGIPCIKFTWIIDSCKKNELLSYLDYVLPSGFSILTNNLLQDRNIYKKSQLLFKGTKIYLTSSNSELTVKWLPLFIAAKATMLDNLPDLARTKPNCDLVVTDSTCDPEIVKKVNSLKVPIVSIEYIIQCLIHGKRLNVDSHPSFSHNYVSS